MPILTALLTLALGLYANHKRGEQQLDYHYNDHPILKRRQLPGVILCAAGWLISLIWFLNALTFGHIDLEAETWSAPYPTMSYAAFALVTIGYVALYWQHEAVMSRRSVRYD